MKDFSAFFSLNSRDLINGLVVAVGGAVIAAVAQQFDAPGFDYLNFQWGEVFKVAVSAFIAYIGKNLLTTSNGKFGGVI